MKRLLRKMPYMVMLVVLILGTTVSSGCGGQAVLNIVFTTTPQVLDADLESGVMTIQIQDAKGKPSNVKTDTVINLILSSTAGKFDTSPAGSYNGDITSVMIQKGTNKASFYYRDGTAGTPTVTVTETPSQGWNWGMQPEKVNPALVITTMSLANGDAGTSYTQNLGSAGGTDTYTWMVSAGNLPIGLALSGNTISGTPTTAGISGFTVKVSDGIDIETKELSITINPTLVVSTNIVQSGDPGISYTQTLAASGGSSNYSWTIAEGTLPVGLSLDSATGVISGIPTVASTSNFTVKVSDGIGTATRLLSMTVNPALNIVTSILPNGTQNVNYSQVLSAAGGSGNYTWSITGGALPTGLTLSGNTISGTPTANGEFSFTVQVSDGIGAVARGMSITIIRIRT